MTRLHYTDCGLDWVWLENGFERHATDYGPGTSITNADDLHQAIAAELVCRSGALRGQEAQFLRAFLRMGADELDLVLAQAGAPSAVSAWESEREVQVPSAASVALRAYVLGVLKVDRPAARITGSVGNPREPCAPVVFHLGPFGWTMRRGPVMP